ncbi:cupin-like domain-containing protein [Fluviispira vulneris]|uniref:cupin-like domain-containing protein n=1 Tax=Fluviispira vulneris TaxID=2763012 RepID=UPI001648739D|nr:cupin-like domain-containing protein [Fluviispira vulneris]
MKNNLIEYDSKIDDIKCFSTEELQNSCIVIRNYCKNWKLYHNNMFEYIANTYGHDRINVETNINGIINETINIKEYINRIALGISTIGNWSWQPFYKYPELHDQYTLPEKMEDIFFRNSLVCKLVISPWLLMSSKDTKTNIHQDMFRVNGIVGQLEGEKEFVLVEPSFKLEEGKYYAEEELHSLSITYYKVILKKGDFLYFPTQWWHQAKTLKNSVTFIHSTVNNANMKNFLDELIIMMPNFIQRVQNGAKQMSLFGKNINWVCNGFKRIIE